MDKRILLISLLIMGLVGLVASAGGEHAKSNQSETIRTTELNLATELPTTTTTSTTTTTTTATPMTTTTTTTTSAKPSSKVYTCAQNCTCFQTRMDCSSRGFLELPKLNQKQVANMVEFNFSNNLLASVDLKVFPMDTVQVLDFSRNRIASLPGPAKKPKLSNLIRLDLSQNELSSLSTLSQYELPDLESLNLANNRLSSFNGTDLSRMKTLRALNMSQAVRTKLPDSIFAKLPELESLDLSGNELVDVPEAVREAPAIKRLLLNRNLMTSLRPSDFMAKQALEHLEVSGCDQLVRIDSMAFGKLPSLQTLIMTDNKRLSDIAGDSFTCTHKALRSVDLRNNNLEYLPCDFRDLNATLHLAGNPWDCSCQLQWILNLTRQVGSQPIHCASPNKYKDMEVGQVLTMISCQPEESMMQRFVLVIFLLFLIVLTVAVFVQRADICRRLHWRDQYGTIYYTKARFPTEQV